MGADARSSLTGRSLMPFFCARTVPPAAFGFDGPPRAASTSSRYCTFSCALLGSREVDAKLPD